MINIKMLKRKLQSTESEMNKCQKLSRSVVVPEQSNLRNLPFKLTDQTAKKNLIAGARRKHYEKDPKQKSTKIMFIAGAYLEVVLPTIKVWSDICGSSFSYGGLNIRVSR